MPRQLHAAVPTSETPGCRLQRQNIQMRDLCHPLNSCGAQEEFVVLLPTADVAASLARAERLRLKVKELTILHQGKSMGMLTISVGVAAFPEHGMSPKELMAAADAALYKAKRGDAQPSAGRPNS
jgi:diguanylate cyclase (GGDEF)-like protein